MEGVGKVGLSFAGVEGGVVLGSRDCCTEVASGEGRLAFVGLGVTLGEPEEDLVSGCTEDSRETGKATFVGSGVGFFFLGLCVVSPSSPDSRGSVLSSATGDSSWGPSISSSSRCAPRSSYDKDSSKNDPDSESEP